MAIRTGKEEANKGPTIPTNTPFFSLYFFHLNFFREERKTKGAIPFCFFLLSFQKMSWKKYKERNKESMIILSPFSYHLFSVSQRCFSVVTSPFRAWSSSILKSHTNPFNVTFSTLFSQQKHENGSLLSCYPFIPLFLHFSSLFEGLKFLIHM